MMSPAVAARTVRLRRLGLEVFWVMAGQVVGVLGGIVGVRLLTEVLPPSTYGQLALTLTISTLVQQVFMGPLSQAALRFYGPAKDTEQLSTFLAGMQRTTKQATMVIVTLAGMMLLILRMTDLWIWAGLGSLAVAFSLVSGYGAIFDGMQIAARHRGVVAWHQGLTQWLRPGIAIALIAAFGPKSAMALLGYVAAALLTLTSQAGFFAHRPGKGLSVRPVSPDELRRHQREIIRYGWPFLAWGAMTWLQVSSDRWALQMFQGSSAVGLYAAIYQLGFYPLMIVSGACVQFLAPIFFTQAGDGSDRIRLGRALDVGERLVWGSLAATLVATAGVYVLKTPILQYFAGPEYRSGAVYLPWLVLAGGLFAAGQVAALMLMTGVESHRLAIPKVTTAAAGAAMNFVGAAVFGVLGVALANAIFAAWYCLWTFLLAHEMRLRVASR